MIKSVPTRLHVDSLVSSTPDLARSPDAHRRALRQRLLAARAAFGEGPRGEAAAAALAEHLADVLVKLEPRCLGVYWPIRAEFNPRRALERDPSLRMLPLAMPYCRRDPREMHFRMWDGEPPRERDECNIPASDGAVVVPDVVLAPCVGYTRSGFRLGYGGGYFDRWLSGQPHVCAVGLAWSACEIGDSDLEPQPYDIPLTVIVTEAGVVG
jgi:5-formyltetrahydrofolate cyclo-ligase